MRRFPARICSKVDFPATYEDVGSLKFGAKFGEARTSVCTNDDRSGSRWKLEGNIRKRGYVVCAVMEGEAVYCDGGHDA